MRKKRGTKDVRKLFDGVKRAEDANPEMKYRGIRRQVRRDGFRLKALLMWVQKAIDWFKDR